MVLKSPLFEQIKKYLTQAGSEEQIFFYVPYIKTKILSKLVENLNNKIIIVTTWHPNDLLQGSSELELFPFCKKNNITLYTNDKIHLKVYSVNLQSAIITSGNISHNGLMPEGNYEVGAIVKKLSSEDRLYFEKIRNEAILVTDEFYQEVKEWYDKQTKETPKEINLEDIISIPKKDYFLRSALPMTRDVNDLVDGYEKITAGLEPSENPETAACIFHDLANYKIELGLSSEAFLEKLEEQFFVHPFIKKIDEFINPEAYWGEIRLWIRDHCTDVPLPRPWELTDNVQTLYEWFVKLGEGKYEVDVPGQHSERIRKITTAISFNYQNQEEYEKEVLKILASPGYTINEIQERYKTFRHRDIHENPSELENKSKPIWHYKIELNEKIERLVSNYTSLDDSVKKRINKNIAYCMGRLEKRNIIVFWFHIPEPYSDGIWRLAEKGKQEI